MNLDFTVFWGTSVDRPRTTFLSRPRPIQSILRYSLLPLVSLQVKSHRYSLAGFCPCHAPTNLPSSDQVVATVCPTLPICMLLLFAFRAVTVLSDDSL